VTASRGVAACYLKPGQRGRALITSERVTKQYPEGTVAADRPGLEVPPGKTARARSGRIEAHVIDCGPGVPETDRDKMFAPFQRLSDTGSTTGARPGLAVSRGLTEAMRGNLQPAQTPGGGLTMTMSLSAAPRPTRAHLPGCRPRGRAGS